MTGSCKGNLNSILSQNKSFDLQRKPFCSSITLIAESNIANLLPFDFKNAGSQREERGLLG